MYNAPASDSLFTYGTLMCQDIMRLVTGFIPESVPARLEGYSRHALKKRVYPALLPAPRIATAGIVYTGIDAAAFVKLDNYEGDMYSRCRVSVHCNHRLITAFTYVLKPELHHLAEPHDWDYDHFLAHHAQSYCANLAIVNKSELC